MCIWDVTMFSFLWYSKLIRAYSSDMENMRKLLRIFLNIMMVNSQQFLAYLLGFPKAKKMLYVMWMVYGIKSIIIFLVFFFFTFILHNMHLCLHSTKGWSFPFEIYMHSQKAVQFSHFFMLCWSWWFKLFWTCFLFLFKIKWGFWYWKFFCRNVINVYREKGK